MNNVFEFTTSTHRLTTSLFNFSCRVKEVITGMELFDSEQYPEEYLYLEDNYLVLVEEINSLLYLIDKFTDVTEDEARQIVDEFSTIREFSNHWWYEYLDQEKLAKEIANGNFSVDNSGKIA